jgi:hypothetical protein
LLSLLVELIQQFFFGESRFFEYLEQESISHLLVFSILNILLLGQDVLLFLGSTGESFYLSSNFRLASIQPYRSLLIPQGWSLALEFYFYLIAPYFIRFRRLVFLFLVSFTMYLLSVIFKVADFDPWSYRCFPIELLFFVLGSLLHRFCYYVKINERISRLPKKITAAISTLLIPLCVFYPTLFSP